MEDVDVTTRDDILEDQSRALEVKSLTFLAVISYASFPWRLCCLLNHVIHLNRQLLTVSTFPQLSCILRYSRGSYGLASELMLSICVLDRSANPNQSSPNLLHNPFLCLFTISSFRVLKRFIAEESYHFHACSIISIQKETDNQALVRFMNCDISKALITHMFSTTKPKSIFVCHRY